MPGPPLGDPAVLSIILPSAVYDVRCDCLETLMWLVLEVPKRCPTKKLPAVQPAAVKLLDHKRS